MHFEDLVYSIDTRTDKFENKLSNLSDLVP